MSFIKLSLILLLTIVLYTPASLAKAVKVQTNVPSASLIVDGILAGKTSKGRTTIDLGTGWRDITITSKGYLTKNYRAYISPKSPGTLFFALNKLPTPDTADKVSPYTFPKEQLTPLQFVSSCNQINKLTSGSQRAKLSCKERTLAAEIQATGPHISNQSSLKTAAQRLVMEKFIDVSLGDFSVNWVILGERLHQITEANVEGFEAAAWASLFDGNCNRVSELFEYVKVLARFSPALSIFQSVCYEMHEKKDLARKTIEQGLLEKGKDTNSSAALYYHKARLELSDSIDKALATLNTCIQKYPWYQRCYLFASDLELAKGRLKEHYAFKGRFRATSEKIISPKIEAAISEANKRRYKEAMTYVNELGFYANSFSAAWLKVLLEQSIKKRPSLSTLSTAMFSNVFAPKSASKVQKLIENMANAEIQEKSLKILIRDLPKNPFYLWKLSSLLLQQGRCKEVLEIELPIYKMQPKQRAGLLEHRARCYQENKDFDSAEKELIAMSRLIPTDWRVHYQLGNAYFKNRNKFKAITSYRETLSLKPPEEYVKLINQRLDELGLEEDIKK